MPLTESRRPAVRERRPRQIFVGDHCYRTRPRDSNSTVVITKPISSDRRIGCGHLIQNLDIIHQRLEPMRTSLGNIEREITVLRKFEPDPLMKGGRARPQRRERNE